MPGLYYKQQIKFADFEVDVFALDTNWEDSHVGRHGGICKQALCVKYYSVTEPTGKEEDCKAFFNKLGGPPGQGDGEQWAWLAQEIPKSTARWKVIHGHHRPT